MAPETPEQSRTTTPDKAARRDRPYHHGDLRRALINAALEAIAQEGPAGISLRALARRAGVSHAAPTHHFRDKAGLLTAVAVEGFDLLADTLQETAERTGSFLELGVAYVRFALEHTSHFAVMFRPDLYHASDPEVRRARGRSTAVLASALENLPNPLSTQDRDAARLAAWSLMHGLATLWSSGSLIGYEDDPLALARRVASTLSPTPLPPTSQ